MNTLQFISELVGSLSWPLTIIILIILLRKEISDLLMSMTRVKFRDLEMDFQRLAESARQLPPSPPLSDLMPQDRIYYASLEDQMLHIAEEIPSAAILLAWASVETALSSAVARMAISPDPPQYRSAFHNMEQLKDWAGLSQEAFDTINEMRILRNKMAHDEKRRITISKNDALTYVKTAIRIIHYLNGLSRGTPSK